MKKYSKIINICLFALVLSILFGVDIAFAQSEGNVFKAITDKSFKILKGLKPLVYVIAGFGLIVFAWAAIFGKISWKHFANIAIGLFLVASMGMFIQYFTHTTGGGSTVDLAYGSYLKTGFGDTINASSFGGAEGTPGGTGNPDGKAGEEGDGTDGLGNIKKTDPGQIDMDELNAELEAELDEFQESFDAEMDELAENLSDECYWYREKEGEFDCNSQENLSKIPSYSSRASAEQTYNSSVESLRASYEQEDATEDARRRGLKNELALIKGKISAEKGDPAANARDVVRLEAEIKSWTKSDQELKKKRTAEFKKLEEPYKASEAAYERDAKKVCDEIKSQQKAKKKKRDDCEAEYKKKVSEAKKAAKKETKNKK